jgi:nitrite reductase/ring-hydroxylating ferredoxin subunit
MGFVKIAELRDIPARAGKRVQVNGTDVALFRREGNIYAINNSCAHQHVSLLHEGGQEGCLVICPRHGWTYDMRTGKSASGQGSVPCYAVRIDGEAVLIDVPEE